jgi:thymidylate kinase
VRRGLLIALSGVDCAGKSTQRDLLMQALRSQGYTPINVYTRVGSTPVQRAVRQDGCG